MTRFATYTGRALYVNIDGVPMTRGVPTEVPQGKLTLLRQHEDVVVADDDSAPDPAPLPDVLPHEPQEA